MAANALPGLQFVRPVVNLFTIVAETAGAGRSPGVQGGGGDWPPPVRSLRYERHNAED
ncbi:conserved hypothetical protein [Klebsiella variicola]|nr:conserved hypothetical protein [Klebsiella variicola]